MSFVKISKKVFPDSQDKIWKAKKVTWVMLVHWPKGLRSFDKQTLEFKAFNNIAIAANIAEKLIESLSNVGGLATKAGKIVAIYRPDVLEESDYQSSLTKLKKANQKKSSQKQGAL